MCDFRPGDRVEVIDSRHPYYGETGIVTRITKKENILVYTTHALVYFDFDKHKTSTNLYSFRLKKIEDRVEQEEYLGEW